MIPLYGSYDRWAVVTGTAAIEDPYTNPNTITKGIWIDDPYNYFSPGTPPETTSTFYTIDPQDPTAPHLDTIFAIDGKFMSVAPMPLSDPIPEPVAIIFFSTGLIALGGYMRKRRRIR